MSITGEQGLQLGYEFMQAKSHERRRQILTLAAYGMPGMSLTPETPGAPQPSTRFQRDRCPGQCGRRVSPGRLCLACKQKLDAERARRAREQANADRSADEQSENAIAGSAQAAGVPDGVLA